MKVLTYLKSTGERSEKNGVEEQNLSRVETGCIRREIVKHTSQNQRDEEIAEKSRVEQGHVSLEP